MAELYIPTPEPVVKTTDGRMTRALQLFFQKLVQGLSAAVTHTDGDLTDHAVILGNGLGDIKAINDIGTAGQVLTSNGAGADPTFETSGTGGTVTNTGTLTDHAVIVGNGGVDVSALASLGSSGQVLTSNGAGADPSFQTVSGTGTVTNTGTLTNHALIHGNGGADVSALGSLGTTTTLLHGNAAGDPTFAAVVEADLSLSNVTTANVTTARHGFAPILPNDATKYLDGTGAYTVPTGSGSGSVTNTGTLTNHALIKGNGGVDVSALASLGTTTTLLHGNASGDPTFGAVVEADLSLTNVTTADVTTSAHGFAPKLPNDSTKFLNGVGGYTVPPGGTFNITSTGAEASLPGSPTAGDLYFPNDGFWIQRSAGGASWSPWGPAFPFTDPGLASISTWVNQGSSTVTTTNGGIVLFGPGGGNTNNLVARVKTAPSTPYTITAAIIPGFPLKNVLQCGILFRASGAGTMATNGVGFNTALTPAYQLQIEKWNSATSSAGAYVAVGSPVATPMFLRITDDGTNRISSFSTDGVSFTQLHSVGRTNFLTADQVGIFVMTQNGATPNYGVYNTLLSWLET